MTVQLLFFVKGYIPYFNDNTRIAADTTGLCIDNAFIKTNLDFKSGRLTYNLTDLFPLFLIFRSNVLEINDKLTYKYVNKKKVFAIMLKT